MKTDLETKRLFAARGVLLFTLASLLVGCQGGGLTGGETQKESTPAGTSLGTAINKGDLIRASAQGDMNQVTFMLKNGADPNEVSIAENQRMTPLMASVLRDKIAVTEVLLRHGARDLGDSHGYTARDFALHGNKDEMVELFEENGL